MPPVTAGNVPMPHVDGVSHSFVDVDGLSIHAFPPREGPPRRGTTGGTARRPPVSEQLLERSVRVTRFVVQPASQLGQAQ